MNIHELAKFVESIHEANWDGNSVENLEYFRGLHLALNYPAMSPPPEENKERIKGYKTGMDLCRKI